jgi:hypothetical protein
MSADLWDANEHGLWCTCCGNLIASPAQASDDDFYVPDSCRECGFPDAERVADYFLGDDDEDEGEFEDDEEDDDG